MSIDDFKIQLKQEHSRSNAEYLANCVLRKQLDIKLVFKVILANEELYSQRAAWIIGIIADWDANFLKKYNSEILLMTNPTFHDAVLRNAFRSLAKLPIKEKDKGYLFENGLILLNSKSTATAIKTWIIDILFSISDSILELQNELRLVLENQIDSSSKGIKGKMLRTIQEINNNFKATNESYEKH